ncbi:hypothetical protein M011DRAFT_464926 [Sporormia fimetaria CBS 119925]|uniref:Uncharacterized protein n=1 Tax=Sporormia fimetaria CBS 119925 TaxID=1340428 RepID=A0A6A6VKR6_9PLEO|nr:hypothetical protein M011DRAFT_464926 [Sporormia fimetaria CBS 119925]
MSNRTLLLSALYLRARTSLTPTRILGTWCTRCTRTSLSFSAVPLPHNLRTRRRGAPLPLPQLFPNLMENLIVTILRLIHRHCLANTLVKLIDRIMQIRLLCRVTRDFAVKPVVEILPEIAD